MNAAEWQARVDEIGFVRATKELVAETLAEMPATQSEVKALRKTVDDALKLLAENLKRLDKLEGKKP